MSRLVPCSLAAALIAVSCASPVILTPLPDDRLAIRYRLEQRTAAGDWVPVAVGRAFHRDEQIRFRVMSNTGGTLYVLNGSTESLSPIFPGGAGRMEPYFGLGTHMQAHRVGLWPRPDEGSALRFTGHRGTERFLLVFVPDALEHASRDVLAIPPGAEDWDFAAKTTCVATGDLGKVLFHYFEVESR